MSTNPKLSLIVAKSRNGVIGVNGELPWKLSSDLKYFKKITIGKPVLMGRITWESLPFPLPGRPNLILTRDQNYQAPMAEVFHDVYKMIGRGYELAGELGVDEIMLIGGAKLYAALMGYCQRMYVTEVDAMLEGDAHFPAVRADKWMLTQEMSHSQSTGDDYPFEIKVYDRR